MSFETDLRAFILADPTISFLVDSRMYPVILPQAAPYPAISYQTISALRGHHMRGPDFLPSQRLQIDAWSTSWSQTRALANAIRNRIDSLRQTIGSTRVQGIFFDTERHLHETDGSNLVTLYRLSQDFICWFEDAPGLPGGIFNLKAEPVSELPGIIDDLLAEADVDSVPGPIFDLIAIPEGGVLPGDIDDLVAEAVIDSVPSTIFDLSATPLADGALPEAISDLIATPLAD